MNETGTAVSALFNGYSGTTTLANTTGNCTTNLLSGTSISSNPYTNSFPTLEINSSGITLAPNATLNYTTNTQKNMTPKQVHVAVFTITRDVDTNEINSTKFLKEFWVEQKNGTSIDLLAAKQLGNDFDPELTIIKVLATMSF